MHELLKLDIYERVVELCGGGVPTRYVLSHYRVLPPSGDNWEWIEHFDECSADEARRRDQAGRWITIHETGTVLIVDNEPIHLFTRSPNPAEVDAILGKLKP